MRWNSDCDCVDSQLIPDYLVRLPRDAIDGKTLRYRRLTDGSFLLYSIGDNARDDGGDPVVELSRSDSTSMWNGRDLVWPHRASPAEVSALLEQSREVRRSLQYRPFFFDDSCYCLFVGS